jgi:hypothetical protein
MLTESERVIAAFEQITAGVRAHPEAKAILPSLLPAATDADIAAFEEKSGTPTTTCISHTLQTA